MVVVVTVVPAGRRLDPRDTKVVVAPGAVSMAQVSARAASRAVMEIRAPGVGASTWWSPMKQHNWADPWLPPVASAITGPVKLPVRPSHTVPNRSTKKS